MENQMIKEYTSLVSRSLPKSIRQDVTQELDCLISDMLEKRCGSILPTNHDVKVVLAELGEPWELAAKYNPSAGFLIGNAYYHTYMLVLKITVISTVFGVTLARVIELFSNNDVAWYMTIVYWFGSLFQGFFISIGIVTFIFAVIERAEKLSQKHR